MNFRGDTFVLRRCSKARMLRPAAQIVICGLALLALRGPFACGVESEESPAPARGLRPHLAVHLADVGRLESGAEVEAGDVVQVSYVAAGNRYGVVVSIDGRGVVTLHHPPRALDVPRIRARGEVPLPYAFELDDAPAFERFFFVTTPARPLDTGAVLEAARKLASAGVVASRTLPLPLPEALDQSSFLLRKAP